MKICPKCNKEYSSRPALSRDPAYIDICPVCGAREALEMAGIMETDPTYMAVIAAVEEGERAASAAGKKKRGRPRRLSPYERTKAQVHASGNRWTIENFEATH